MESVVDSVPPALLGDLVGGAFGRQVGGEGFGVGDAGEVGAFEDVLVIGFGGKEEGRGLGCEGGCLWIALLVDSSEVGFLLGGERGGRTYCLRATAV